MEPAHRFVESSALAMAKKRSFRKIAGSDPMTRTNAPTAMASPRAPCTESEKKALVLHNRVKPRYGQPGELSHEIAESHQACAFMVIGGQFVAERDERRREHRIGQIKKVRSDQEEQKVEPVTVPGGYLPHEREDQSSQNRPDQDIWSAAPPTGFGVIGNVPHDRVTKSVGESRNRQDGTDPRGVHFQPQVKHDGHTAQGSGQKVVA